jgi:hypothetical protein
MLHRWQEQLCLNAALAPEGTRTPDHRQDQRRIDKLEQKIPKKDKSPGGM